MNAPGDALRRLCAEATTEVILVSPFVRSPALAELLSSVPDHVPVQCITRWRVSDVLSGASDLGTLEVAQSRPRTILKLRWDLHAKLYVADGACLVGSANVTGKALGWVASPNLELLVPVAREEPTVTEFLRNLLPACFPATEQQRAAIQAAVERVLVSGWKPLEDLATATDEAGEAEEAVDPGTWLPRCRVPERLFSVYAGNTEQLGRHALAEAQLDLKAFEVPLGLSQPEFEAIVASALAQMPLVRRIAEQAVTPQSLADVEPILQQASDPPGAEPMSHGERWEVVKRWLMHFFPGTYRRQPAGEDLLVKGRELFHR